MLRQILAIALKDLLVLSKDTGGIAVLLLMPAMFIVVMTLALGGLFQGNDRPILVLLVDEDRGAVAARIKHDFASVEGFRVETEWEAAPLTRATAEALIVKHVRNVAAVIPNGFSRSLEQRALGAPQAEPAARIELIVDPALSAQFVGPIQGLLAGLGERAAMVAAAPRGVDWLIDQIGAASDTRQSVRKSALAAIDGGETGSLVEIHRTQPAGMAIERQPSVVQQNVPGWTLFGVFFIAGTLASSLLEEKKVGTFRRILAAPLRRAVFLLGKLLPNVMVNLVQIALMFAVGVAVMPSLGAPRMDLGPHPEALVVISLAASLAANGLGLLIAALGRTTEQVGGLSSLVVVTMAALGGVMVPRFVMPPFLQTAGLLTPHAWALDAYQDVLVRGYGLGHVLPEIAALLAFAVAFFGIALWRFRWD